MNIQLYNNIRVLIMTTTVGVIYADLLKIEVKFWVIVLRWFSLIIINYLLPNVAGSKRRISSCPNVPLYPPSTPRSPLTISTSPRCTTPSVTLPTLWPPSTWWPRVGSHSCLDVEDLDTDHYTGTPTLGNYEVLNLMSSSFIQMKKISDGFGYMIYCRIPGTTSQS